LFERITTMPIDKEALYKMCPTLRPKGEPKLDEVPVMPEPATLPAVVDPREVPHDAPLPERFTYSTDLALDAQQAILKKFNDLDQEIPVYRATLQAVTTLASGQIQAQLKADETKMKAAVAGVDYYEKLKQALLDFKAKREVEGMEPVLPYAQPVEALPAPRMAAREVVSLHPAPERQPAASAVQPEAIEEVIPTKRTPRPLTKEQLLARKLTDQLEWDAAQPAPR
jgi:hypothetical protein